MTIDVGIDIGGTNIKLGLVDREGRVLARRSLPTKANSGPIPTLERIAAAVSELRSGKRIASVGVGIAGLVDHTNGIVRVPPNLPGWNGTPIKELLTKLLRVPIFVANDVNAMAVGEWLHGAGRGCQDLLCVTLGTGLGGGIITGGKLLLGANHAAGEVGHTSIATGGPPCRCGSRGCVERYVGAAYLVDRARKRIRVQQKKLTVHRNQTSLFGVRPADGPSLILELASGDYSRITTREIGMAARRGDKLAVELVDELAFHLGVGLANAVQIVDPEKIVVGGGVSRIGSPLLRGLKRTVFAYIPNFPGRRLDICFAELGNDAGIVGAARLRRIELN